ncbi:hypothetical protein QOT17_012267 [Balamuthia mandrillaris]
MTSRGLDIPELRDQTTSTGSWFDVVPQGVQEALGRAAKQGSQYGQVGAQYLSRFLWVASTGAAVLILPLFLRMTAEVMVIEDIEIQVQARKQQTAQPAIPYL